MAGIPFPLSTIWIPIILFFIFICFCFFISSTFTVDFSPEYLREFSIRFENNWWICVSSPIIFVILEGKLFTNLTLYFFASGRKLCVILFIILFTLQVFKGGDFSCNSNLERESKSSTNLCIRMAWSCIKDRNNSLFSLSLFAWPFIVSIKPIIEDNGVLNSWLALETKSLLIWSTILLSDWSTKLIRIVPPVLE